MGLVNRVRNSWSIQFVRENMKYMTFLSSCRFRKMHRLRALQNLSHNPIQTLNLHKPISGKVSLRTFGSDLDTFKEIVVKEVYDVVLNHLPNCLYVIDLGANIGLASLYFATHFPDARLFSVEADEENFELLRKNLEQVRFANRCKPVHAAVWSEHVTLSLSRPAGADRFSSIEVAEHGAGEVESVEGIPLDMLIKQSQFPYVDLLKVDIESAEVELFKRYESWLPMVNAIAIEFHDNSRQESQFDVAMNDAGFKILHDGAHTVLAVRS